MRDLKNVKGKTNNINVVEGGVNNNGNIVYGTLVINNPNQIQSEINYDVNCGNIKLKSKVSLITGGSFSFIGFIGLISSLFTIKDALLNSVEPNTFLNFVYSLLLFIGIGILSIVIGTNSKGILSLFSKTIFATHFAKFDDGVIRNIKVKGKCPKENCGGKLRFNYNIESDKYFFTCSRNPSQHKYEFDFTSLEYE